MADGAIGFYCDHHVSARMSKYMYGVEYLREFDPSDDDHISRKHRLFELPSGPRLLPDAFDCILARVRCNTLTLDTFIDLKLRIERKGQGVDSVQS